jgi:hypothetical protein
MFMETNTEDRNTQRVNRINYAPRLTRRCSFCRTPGHTITHCNSERLLNFESVCVETARNINVPDEFKKWLSDNYMNNQTLLKTFVIIKMGYTTRSYLPNCIDLITDYIYRKYRPEMFNYTRTNINLHSEDTNTDENAFRNEVINFLMLLRNNRNIYREQFTQEQEVHNMRDMETNLVQEAFLTFVYNNHRVGLSNGPRKFNINSVIDISDDVCCENETTRCNICWDEKENAHFVTFGCNHDFCKDCVITSLRGEQREHPSCALCRSSLQTMTCKNAEIHTELAEFVA